MTVLWLTSVPVVAFLAGFTLRDLLARPPGVCARCELADAGENDDPDDWFDPPAAGPSLPRFSSASSNIDAAAVRGTWWRCSSCERATTTGLCGCGSPDPVPIGVSSVSR
jgi:hypothetical protein